MDEYFDILSPGSILWMEEALTTGPQSKFSSAFAIYRNNAHQLGLPNRRRHHHQNVHRRIIQFLKNRAVDDRRLTTTAPDQTAVPEMEKIRSNMHKIMGERMRRRMHRQGYQALHHLLPSGTKNDKKSILEMAAKEIRELHQQKQRLTDKGLQIMKNMPTGKGKEIAEIQIKVTAPASGIDSMLELLKCLKDTDSTALALNSQFSDHEFSAVLELETKIRAADVEMAVQRTLHDAERKFRDKN